MNEPLVSIITPSYNQAQFLEQTIQSVLGQTYKNIEYFVMDGGSIDGSVEIIKKYEEKLTYWQSKSDDGQSDAINSAFKKCKGDIIAYINSDDLLMPEAVETVVRCFEVNADYALVFGICSTIDENGNEIAAPQGDHISFNHLLMNGMLPKIFQPACFFNRKYINREFFLDKNLKYAFDYELLLMLMKWNTNLFIYKHFAAYRKHKDAKSLNIKEAYFEKLKVQMRYGKRYTLLWVYRWLKFLISMQLKKFVKSK